MSKTKKMPGLVIVLVLGLSITRCEPGSSLTEEIFTEEIFTYELGEFNVRIFDNSSHEMALNAWFVKAINRGYYDDWSEQEGVFLYRDKALTQAFVGSDMVKADTVAYCNIPLNNRGKKTSEITGTITLADITNPALVVVIDVFGNGWWSSGRINMSNISENTAELNWSIPVHENDNFKPNQQYYFRLHFRPIGSRSDGFSRNLGQKTVGNAGANIGNIGTAGVKTITLSGTINVNAGGEPIPYVLISARYPVGSESNIIELFSPGPDSPWSIVTDVSDNSRDMEFHIMGAKDWTLREMIFDIQNVTGIPVRVLNQNIPGIVLDLGDVLGSGEP